MPVFLCLYSLFFYCKYVPYLNLSPFGDKYKVKVYIYK